MHRKSTMEAPVLVIKLYFASSTKKMGKIILVHYIKE